MNRNIMSRAFAIQEHMMSIMGYWHKENSSAFYKIRGTVTMLIFLVAYVLMLMQFFHDIVDFRKFSEILCMLMSYTSYFCKLCGYLYSRKTFLEMLSHLKNPIFTRCSPEMERHLIKTLNLSLFITKLYRFSCGMVVILFSIYPLFDDKPLPTSVPFETGRYTFLLYIIESLAMLIAAWDNFCLDTLCTSLMGTAIGQFDILKEKILTFKERAIGEEEIVLGVNFKTTNIFEANVNKRAKSLLNDCIVHHNALIKFVQQIEDTFSFGLLSQLMGSIIVICNTGFFLMLVSPASLQFGLFSSYFITMMAQLTLYCWYGNEIMLKSVQIGEACYFSQWYTCTADVKRSIFIIMEKSRRPLAITALKFTTLSLETFAAIIRSSYSYFALLQRLANKFESETK
uniref:Odorant receptor n=1 Tax=Protaetia brevitarsis TaxID=348688 RepID=A0A411HR23_PROBE|nr:odorant receptor [Protaetia brevitarsis]